MRRLALITLAALATTTALAGTASAYDRYGHGSGGGYGHGSGSSDNRGDRIDRRQVYQYLRIYGAALSGELTWGEGTRLLREQDRIGRMEKDARRDGHITRDEARRIQEAQNAASSHIYQESTDWQHGW